MTLACTQKTGIHAMEGKSEDAIINAPCVPLSSNGYLVLSLFPPG